MQVLNLEEKNTERMEAINKFTLMDDTFMTQVFSGNLECTEELLKIILKRNDLSVIKSVTQLTIGNLFGRSVRLDIYANNALLSLARSGTAPLSSCCTSISYCFPVASLA